MRCSKFFTVAGKMQSTLVLLSVLVLATVLGEKTMAEQNVTHAPQSRNHVFANKIFLVLSEGNAKNLIFSPLSLEIVLAVAGLGARGETRAQIGNGIGLPLEVEPLRTRYAPLLTGVKDDSGCILRIATRIFVEKGFPLQEEFVKSSADAFLCGLESVEFVSNPDQALLTVNSWAEEKTQGLIKNLLERGDITDMTRLVLTNAVYFKGKWAHQFDPANTRKEKFHLIDGSTVDVDMMHIERRFRFGRPNGLNAKVLELPYQGDQLSMVILLPDSSSSIADLEGKVSAEAFDLDALLSNHTYPSEVSVSLPKFKLEVTSDLEEPLTKLGMNSMFSDQANFSGITSSQQGLKVSKVVQKAFIEVTEEGTEAAAATGAEGTFLSLPPQFRADRPFVLMLWHKITGTRLFVGHFMTPGGLQIVAASLPPQFRADRPFVFMLWHKITGTRLFVGRIVTSGSFQ